MLRRLDVIYSWLGINSISKKEADQQNKPQEF